MENTNFTFFYTFDYIEKYDFYMLVFSLFSIIREFGNTINILIFTSNTDKLKNAFQKYKWLLNIITILKYDPKQYNHRQQNLFQEFKKHNIIGHARIFLFEKLLNKYKHTVIYMDNDTGIRLNGNIDCLSLINQNKPFIYMKQKYPLKYIYVFDEPGNRFDRKFDKFDNTVQDLCYNFNITTLNNGIIIFPYNDESITVLKRIKTIYNDLIDAFPSGFHDMTALTFSFNEFDLQNCIDTFSDDYEKYGFNIKDIPCFIHYFYTKYLIKYNEMDIVNDFLEKEEKSIHEIQNMIQNFLSMTRNPIVENQYWKYIFCNY